MLYNSTHTNRSSHRDRTQTDGCQGLRRGKNREKLLNRQVVLLWSDGNVFELNGSGSCTTS